MQQICKGIIFIVYIFAYKVTIKNFELNLAGEIVRQHAHKVSGFCFIHDFVITPNYCIFFQNPVTFNPIPFWSAAPRGFVGEPIFVPRPDSEKEDDGWVLALVYDAAHHRSDVIILDASDFSKGTIARLHLKHHIPYGLHGSFTSEIFGEI